MVYIIEKFWYDPLENRDASGWEVVGYVETLFFAENIAKGEWLNVSDSPYPLKYEVDDWYELSDAECDEKKITVYRFREIKRFVG